MAYCKESVKIMGNSTHQRGPVALFAALLAFLSTVTPMACRAQSSSSSSSTNSNSGADQPAVEKYWTPERMRAAKPMELHPKTDVTPSPAAHATPDSHAPPTGGSGQPPGLGPPK